MSIRETFCDAAYRIENTFAPKAGVRMYPLSSTLFLLIQHGP